MVDKASLRHREQFVSSCKKIETLFNGTVVLHQQNTGVLIKVRIPTILDYNREINNTMD